ncbi:hypothetical protein N7462_000827 [Penicillium macrosclerotiorum]|uniref:uncharacterized protein n=1 Tax=Penicillium macrosclerotiorum TaxID=303699 RepID=UPI002548594C|nr:uncharacterized protein N7462_000827 [Penicillium macrosclerotiorum]KAJ5698822.1 hypothetical protein N7462_000827 [Penicillium macrosclerotiorum]
MNVCIQPQEELSKRTGGWVPPSASFAIGLSDRRKVRWMIQRVAGDAALDQGALPLISDFQSERLEFHSENEAAELVMRPRSISRAAVAALSERHGVSRSWSVERNTATAASGMRARDAQSCLQLSPQLLSRFSRLEISQPGGEV